MLPSTFVRDLVALSNHMKLVLFVCKEVLILYERIANVASASMFKYLINKNYYFCILIANADSNCQ